MPSDDFSSWLDLRAPQMIVPKIKKAPLPSLPLPPSASFRGAALSVRAPRSDFPSPGNTFRGRKTFRNPEATFRNGTTFRPRNPLSGPRKEVPAKLGKLFPGSGKWEIFWLSDEY